VPETGELNFASVVHLARTAERGLFDFVLVDGHLTVLAALAAVTQRIGLVSTVDTAAAEPFTVARQLATLDHLCEGRAGWHVTWTDSRTDEFLAVADALWGSWAPDAVVADAEAGIYVDPARVRAVDHRGARYTVRGVATLPSGPQGRPVLLQNSDAGGGGALVASHRRGAATAKVLHAMTVVSGGDPRRMVDDIEQRVRSGACDGFVLRPQSGNDLDDFVADVVPRLRERGCFHGRYSGFTLREHLGL
jgi:alkanesulfonate monooxygenase SsuD/methylene tetrahydromethanopterin reductase-like flavin-dependent oxidoreductase (luciferase family)